ncbi:hypothetical protein D9M72_337780 [compost metagenome]
MDRGEKCGGGELAVSGHREHQAGPRRLDGQGADKDRDGDVHQEDLAPEGSQDGGEHIGQALCGEASVVEAGGGHECGDDHESAADTGNDQGRKDGAGCGPARVFRLFRELPGGVETDHDVGGHEAGDEERAHGPEVRAGHHADVRHYLGSALGGGNQGEDDGGDADDFAGHADGVDVRHELDAQAVDHRGDHEECGPEDYGVGGAGDGGQCGIAADNLETVPQLREDHLECDGGRGRSDNLGDRHEPAREPAHHFAAHAAGPLVDGAGQRVAGGEFGEVQGNEQLADQHHRPGPEERGSGKGVPEGKELEDGGQDGNERESCGKGGVAAKFAVQ